jgi:hypothetical protein
MSVFGVMRTFELCEPFEVAINQIPGESLIRVRYFVHCSAISLVK